MNEISEEPLDLSITSGYADPFLNCHMDATTTQTLLNLCTNMLNEDLIELLTRLANINNKTEIEPKQDDTNLEKGNLINERHSPSNQHAHTIKRCEANARERCRVQQLSNMFNVLRVALPINRDMKISKLSTLKVATLYIGFLSSILDEKSGEMENYQRKLIDEIESAKNLKKNFIVKKH